MASNRVMLIDDDLRDIELIRQASDGIQWGGDALLTSRDDAGVVGTLESLAEELPDLVLLDLHMPNRSGMEVLVELRETSLLASLPVIVLSGHASRADVFRCYALGANCYLRKPADFDSLRKLMHQIDDFWFGQVLLPSSPV